MLGLAHRFSTTFKTTYVAGLWWEGLYRGLVWGRQIRSSLNQYYDEPEKPDEPGPNHKLAPSWTWVTTAGLNEIGYSWTVPNTKGDRYRIYPIQRLLFPTDAELVETSVTRQSFSFRGYIKGKLKLWGLVVKTRVLPPEYFLVTATSYSRK